MLVWGLLGSTAAPKQNGSYIRQAYRDGLSLQGANGYNPYKFGIVSGADSHDAAAACRLHNFFGMHGLNDSTPEKRLSSKKHLGMDNRTLSPAGITAIWCTPTQTARAQAGTPMTIADLERQGGKALDDTALTQLVAGNTVVVQNRVTGQKFDIFYGRDGRRLVAAETDGAQLSGEFGNVLKVFNSVLK